jgi:aminoglycoside 2'-N-acetyltransferase I
MDPMLQTGHTAEIDLAVLGAARALLVEAFDDFTDEDWEHCLGGLHALVWDGPDLVGHASVVQRRLLHSGRALRAGYVEGVAVRASHRRRGHGATMMAALERVVRGAYDLGALSASGSAVNFYAGRGWRSWEGPTFALTPEGIRRTADEDDGVFVLPHLVALDLTGELTCDWREGDVW